MMVPRHVLNRNEIATWFDRLTMSGCAPRNDSRLVWFDKVGTREHSTTNGTTTPLKILSILSIDVKRQSPSPGGRGAGGEDRTHLGNPLAVARIIESPRTWQSQRWTLAWRVGIIATQVISAAACPGVKGLLQQEGGRWSQWLATLRI